MLSAQIVVEHRAGLRALGRRTRRGAAADRSTTEPAARAPTDRLRGHQSWPSSDRRRSAISPTRLDLQPTKKLGQNFVVDANTVRRIVQDGRRRPGDEVLEVGPGLGSLTLGLLEAGARVTAVEIDKRLAAQLPQTVELMQPGAPLTVVARGRAARHSSCPATPDPARREPAVQRLGARAAAPARARCRASSRAS